MIFLIMFSSLLLLSQTKKLPKKIFWQPGFLHEAEPLALCPHLTMSLPFQKKNTPIGLDIF